MLQNMVLFDVNCRTGGTRVLHWEQVYQKWLAYDHLDTNLKEQLIEMKNEPSKLEDAFYDYLSFGTGGMRGILGPGINRMNIYTVRKAVEGLAHYIAENVANYKDRGVVVAYDSRYMSKQFAIETAKVLGAHHIKSYVFDTIQPTPLLSFAVRYIRAAAGVMITASHNPPEYNGFKVYNERGSQISLDEANEIIQYIQQVENELTVETVEEEELTNKFLLRTVYDEVNEAYLDKLRSISKLDEKTICKEKDLTIVYTPLHGTGLNLVEKGLKQLNFNKFHIVKEQAVPDPEFSTVASPNPEEKQAFTYAMELGEKVNADILLATDPDADRLGVAVKDKNNEYVILTGNQLGSLLLDYILRHTNQRILPYARMVKTIVTTELGRAIADYYGVQTVDTLTGFKYIGEKINEYDTTGEAFIFGYEESYGYLISSFARDKDAIQASVMACEMAYFWKERGLTLLDALEELYKRHGYYKEGLDDLKLEGKAGQEKIKAIVNSFRETEHESFGGLQVEFVEDYLLEKIISRKAENKVSTTRLPKENVIKYKLENNCWICIRPSGTEPKIKWYYGAYGETEKEAVDRLNRLKEALKNHIIQPITWTQ